MPHEPEPLPPYLVAFRAAVTPLDAERKSLATKFEPHFRALVRAIPAGTYEEKKFAARVLNAELRVRGLGVRCPKTNKASFLVADPGGDHPEIGRFQFAHPEDGKTVRTFTCRELTEVAVIPDELGSGEGPGTWAAKANRAPGSRKKT